MVIPVDVLIIGAGVQGLLLLRRLVQDYSVVVVGTDLRVSETQHAHGYFASGWNAHNVEAACVYRQAASWWREFLLRHQVNPSENVVHRTGPARTLDRLSAIWREAGIPFRDAALPAPFDLSPWPTHRTVAFPEDLVFDAATAVHELRHPFVRHVLEGTVTQAQIERGRVAEVTAQTADGEVRFAPGTVLGAAGAGNAAVFNMLGLPEAAVTQSQVARPRYMVCLRGAALPNVSLFANELTIAAHRMGADEVAWLVTYDPPRPRLTPGMLGMARDPKIAPSMVCATLNRLKALIPAFVGLAAGCMWDVYVGWKTDAPSAGTKASPKPYDVRSFGFENFLATWPNHWGLATPAVMDAATVVRETLVQRHDQPTLSMTGELHADANKMKWLRSDRPWQQWAQFVERYGFDCDDAD
jgi:hypothetical protein